MANGMEENEELKNPGYFNKGVPKKINFICKIHFPSRQSPPFSSSVYFKVHVGNVKHKTRFQIKNYLNFYMNDLYSK